MKKLITILTLLLSLTISTQAQFSVVSTNLIEKVSYKNIYTSFLTPATSKVEKEFPSSYGLLVAQENIVDARVQNGAIVEARAMVSPLQAGDVLTSNLSFYALFRDSNVENCQVQISIQLLYEVRNEGAGVADLYYGLNPDIVFLKNGSFAGGSGQYSIQLRESDASGTSGTLIHNSFNMEVSMNNNIRGTAYSNVPSGATRYLLLEVWVYAASENALGSLFLVDASQGLSVGFDDQAIPANDGLNNDPFIDVKAKLKFQVHNLFATTPSGPAMGATGALAYDTLTWHPDVSSGYAIAENTDILNTVDGITVTMEDFHLVDFDPYALSLGFGSSGDRRTYVDGVAKIYQNEVLKMEIVDCRIGMNIDYPAPFGTGSEATGGGWGRISILNTDPAWLTEFDENLNQQIEFVFHSFSTVVNNPFYDAIISIVPAEYRDEYVGWQVSAGGGIVDGNDSVGIRMNFSNVGEAGDAYARLLSTDPGGSVPAGIQNISADRFWELGATFSSFTVDVDFDLGAVNGITDMNNIRILHREDSSEVWTILDPINYTIVGNKITVAGITDFSQFGIASTGGNPLPVELTSFTAKATDGGTLLNWSTATEVNNYGFEIETSAGTTLSLHSDAEENRSWETIGFVEGHGNSNSPKEYTYFNLKVAEQSRSYRLKQIDTDGNFEYFPNAFGITVSGSLSKTELFQNHPNPFNPSTKISFALADVGEVNISIYNMLGQKVAELINSKMDIGTHTVEFDASNLSSGFYIYKLVIDSYGDTPNYFKTMKMLLIK